MKTQDFNKVVHPFDMDCYSNGRKYPVYCTVKLSHGHLSISGVINPTHGGNAGGGCGQIDMHFEHRNP